MKPILRSTPVWWRMWLALLLLALTKAIGSCEAMSSSRNQQQLQDGQLSRQTTPSVDWPRSESQQQQHSTTKYPPNTDHAISKRESAFVYDQEDSGFELNNESPPPPPPPPSPPVTIKVYERVVLEGSKIRISCPHYTPTIAPAETLFSKSQRNGNPNERKQPSPTRGYKENSREKAAAAAGAPNYNDDDERTTALNSNSGARVKWFRNHVPLQNLNHFHHQGRQAQHESSSSSAAAAAYESQTPSSMFKAAITTFATTPSAKITELNRTTELSQTVPAHLGNKQQWQATRRKLLATSGLAASVEAERSVSSLTSESVNEPTAYNRKLANMPELEHSGQQSLKQRREQEQQWYVNKFGELVINEVSRYFAGKYTCLVEGKQSEVLVDVLLDSQAADRKPEQAYRIEEEQAQWDHDEKTVMSFSDVSSSKVVDSEASAPALRLPKFTAPNPSGGGNNNNELALSLSNKDSAGDERAREKTGSELTGNKGEDTLEEKANVLTEENDLNSSLTSFHRVETSLVEQQLSGPTLDSSAITDRHKGIQETGGQHSTADKNSSQFEENSIESLDGGVIQNTGSSEQKFSLLSSVPTSTLSVGPDYALGGDGSHYKTPEAKADSALSVPAVSRVTEIIPDLRSYMFPRKHLATAPPVHLIKSEVILTSDLKSIPGFLFTKQQLHCSIASSQRELKREYIYPLILALCATDQPQPKSETSANLASSKHELQRKEFLCYHLAERLIARLTHNCSTSVFDLVWFKDGKLLEFDADGKEKDRELNIKRLDPLRQFGTTFASSESASDTSSVHRGQNNIESSTSFSQSSRFTNLQGPRWTCPIFSGRTLEIDGVRRDSAGRYTCALRLSIVKLEEIILLQLANTNASSFDRAPRSLLSSVNWSQQQQQQFAHDNDKSCCDEHGQEPIQRGFPGAANYLKSKSKSIRHQRRHSNHQRQQRQRQKPHQSLQTVAVQIETNVSKTIVGNDSDVGGSAATTMSYLSKEHQQRRINLTFNGAPRSLSKRIATLKSILRGEPARAQSLNYIGQTLSRLQIPLEAAATTTIQTFSLLVTEREANSCDLWSTIAEAGNAYTRRKLADFKRLRRSVAVDRERQRMAANNRRRAASRLVGSQTAAYNNKLLKNVYNGKSSSMVARDEGNGSATARMRAMQSGLDGLAPNVAGADAAAAAASAVGRLERHEAEENAGRKPETRPIKRLNVNIGRSVRQLSTDSGGGGSSSSSTEPDGHWNANEDRYRQLGRPNQSGAAYPAAADDNGHGGEQDDDQVSGAAVGGSSIEQLSGGREEGARGGGGGGGCSISFGGKQNAAGPIDEASERNEQEAKEKGATLNALHLMPDNNDSSETLVFTDYQQGYNLLLNNADELESDIETSPGDVGQTKSNSGARSNGGISMPPPSGGGAVVVSSSSSSGGNDDDDDDDDDSASRGHHYRVRSSPLLSAASASTATAPAVGATAAAAGPVSTGAEGAAFGPTPFNYANEANAKLGSHEERSTGSSNPIAAPASTQVGAPGAHTTDEASGQARSRIGINVGSPSLGTGEPKSDRQRLNMMIEANHDYSLAESETKDLITQQLNSASHLAASAAGGGARKDLAARHRPGETAAAGSSSSSKSNGSDRRAPSPESGVFQADGHPTVIDDQKDKVARSIIDGNLVGERRPARTGHVGGGGGGPAKGRAGTKAGAASNAHLKQRGSRPVDEAKLGQQDDDDDDDKDFKADDQAAATGISGSGSGTGTGTGTGTGSEEPNRSRRLRRSSWEAEPVGRQEAIGLADRGDEVNSQAAAVAGAVEAVEAVRVVDDASPKSGGGSGNSFGGPLTNLAGRARRKARRATKSNVEFYVAAAVDEHDEHDAAAAAAASASASTDFAGETRLSWPARAIDEKARDKRQDPLLGNKLLPLAIGGTDRGHSKQSSSWRGNEGSASGPASGGGSIANKPQRRNEDIEDENDQKGYAAWSNGEASQLNGPATQYSSPAGSQFLIDVQAKSTGNARSLKVSPTNQSALPVAATSPSRNFVAPSERRIKSAELAPPANISPRKRATEEDDEEAEADEAIAVPSGSTSNSNSEDSDAKANANHDRDQNAVRGPIPTAAFAAATASAASNDQAPIFSDDRLDESLMWSAGQYLYMHMKALATSSIFGVEVDVEWSNERTNGSTNIDLSDFVDPTDPVSASTAAAAAAATGSAQWQADQQTRYASSRLHDAPFATIDVISGQSLTLQCTAQALGRLPEVKWYKRIHTIPQRLKSLLKMVRRIGNDMYWPLSELDVLRDDNSKRSFVCSQTSTIFDNLINQTFTMVNSLQLSQYNDVVEQETIRSNSFRDEGDYNLYACIVDADVRHNYATLGVHLRQAPRKIPAEISKRLHARSAVLTTSPEPISSSPHMRLIRTNKIDHQQTYTNYDLYREAQKLHFPLKDYWIPIQNKSHLKREFVESPLTPALLSAIIGIVFSSLLALLYLTFRSYRSLTNFQMDFNADEPLNNPTTLSINPQYELIALQEQEEQSNERGNSPLCLCQLESNSKDDEHSLTGSAVMMIEDGSTIFNPENVIYTKFDQDISQSETSPFRSSMPPTFRYDTCSPPYQLCPYSNLHPQVPHEASNIWPQSHASFYEEQAPNLEAH